MVEVYGKKARQINVQDLVGRSPTSPTGVEGWVTSLFMGLGLFPAATYVAAQSDCSIGN